MERKSDFELIPLQLMRGAQCHFCNNVNYPINPKKEFPVTNMEISEKKFFVCDQCMKKNNANNQRG